MKHQHVTVVGGCRSNKTTSISCTKWPARFPPPTVHQSRPSVVVLHHSQGGLRACRQLWSRKPQLSGWNRYRLLVLGREQQLAHFVVTARVVELGGNGASRSTARPTRWPQRASVPCNQSGPSHRPESQRLPNPPTCVLPSRRVSRRRARSRKPACSVPTSSRGLTME